MDEWREIEAIKQLKARYFRVLDTKQWVAWGALFTEDAVVKVHSEVSTWSEPTEPRQVFRGASAIMTQVRDLIDNSVTVHHGHMPEIELVSPTEAKGIWAMEDIVENVGARMRGHGHYHETYHKTDGGWRIATLELTRLRMESVTLTKPAG